MTPFFAFRFQCFQHFRGICFSLEVTSEGAISWGFGTARAGGHAFAHMFGELFVGHGFVSGLTSEYSMIASGVEA
jgi:hypothetical protein